MSAAFLFDAGLCLTILAAALCAVGGRDLFGAIAFYIVYGIAIALAWLRLQAVDVALAEAAIGAGLTGVLLIGAWAMLKRDAVDETPAPPGRFKRLSAGALASGVAGALALAVLTLPPDRQGLEGEVAARIGQSGAENPVTAVLLNFRAYDTLMESVVLLVALVAVWALTPEKMWGGLPGLAQRARPGGVLSTFGRLLPPLGIVVAIYLVWAGSDRPGGAFQAGTVAAAVWLLVVMAGAADEPAVSDRRLRLVLVAGPAIFLAIGAAGLGFGVLLGFPIDFAKPLILTIEFALTLSIAATLALLVAGRPRRTP